MKSTRRILEDGKATQQVADEPLPSSWVSSILAVVFIVTLVASPTASFAAFPGANGKIAYESYRDGTLQIYTMNADGTDQTNLTNNAANNWLPIWSPDGKKIAFYSDRSGNLEIYVMNADGSGVINLSNHAAADRWAYWSPDGTKIVFGSDRDGNNNLYIMNVDGTGVTQLTSDATDYESSYLYPTWSPDGAKIGFTSDRDHDGRWDVYLMNTDGTSVIQLTYNSVNDYGPAWSPDSAKLAFGSGTGQSHDVYVMNPDGSGVTNLTNSPTDDLLPAWSPDGTKIAFTSNRSGNYGICVMNTDGSGVTCLTNNGDNAPNWQPLVDSVIAVTLDIKPGSDPNSINPHSKGKIPVAILTTDTFDATTVDEATVLFGATGTEAALVHAALEDVDGDGDADMIMHFNAQAAGIQCGDTSASLTGETLGGQAIEGSDSVKTVGCK